MNDENLDKIDKVLTMLEKKVDLLYFNLLPLYEGHTSKKRIEKEWEGLTSDIANLKSSLGRNIEIGDENDL